MPSGLQRTSSSLASLSQQPVPLCCSQLLYRSLNFALGSAGTSHPRGLLSILALNLAWPIVSITNLHLGEFQGHIIHRVRSPALPCKRIRLAMASFDAKQIQMQKAEEEWRAVLSPEQFRVLRQKGTEIKGTGEYNKFYEDGLYNCAGCGTPLYKSTTKFDSGCGWPAFYEGLPGAINRNVDADGRRTEITCAACGGHLGHVFRGEGFQVPTDERHCVNSVSIKFIPAN